MDLKNNAGTIWLVGGLILTNIFWGASGVAVKVAQIQLDTWEIITLRFLVATPLLIAFSVAWKGWNVFAVNKNDIQYLIVLSIIGIPLEFFLQVTALAHTSAIAVLFGLAIFAMSGLTLVLLIPLFGAFALVDGILLIMYPLSGALALAKVIGIFETFYGILLIVMSIDLLSMGRSAPARA